MVLDYFFDKNLVFCLEADNQEQLFDQVASLLEEREIVTPLTSSVSSTTSKLCFEQPAASFLVCSLIFIEY
ncbi:PTS system transporter subunit IIA [Streptococcus pneumoniae]|nr:PTS system transporter subunit IIA [Streptococcus pneumoniae]